MSFESFVNKIDSITNNKKKQQLQTFSSQINKKNIYPIFFQDVLNLYNDDTISSNILDKSGNDAKIVEKTDIFLAIKLKPYFKDKKLSLDKRVDFVRDLRTYQLNTSKNKNMNLTPLNTTNTTKTENIKSILSIMNGVNKDVLDIENIKLLEKSFENTINDLLKTLKTVRINVESAKNKTMEDILNNIQNSQIKDRIGQFKTKYNELTPNNKGLILKSFQNAFYSEKPKLADPSSPPNETSNLTQSESGLISELKAILEKITRARLKLLNQRQKMTDKHPSPAGVASNEKTLAELENQMNQLSNTLNKKREKLTQTINHNNNDPEVIKLKKLVQTVASLEKVRQEIERRIPFKEGFGKGYRNKAENRATGASSGISKVKLGLGTTAVISTVGFIGMMAMLTSFM